MNRSQYITKTNNKNKKGSSVVSVQDNVMLKDYSVKRII